MKTGQQQPKIRLTPPSIQSTDASLKRLDQLSKWTEEPAIEAAKSISAPEAVQPPPEPKKKAQAQPKQAGKGAAQEMPWNGEGTEGVRLVNFKLPTKLYLKLKWLGETTYGSNMTQIIIPALEETTTRLLKERGITPPGA